MGRTRLQPSRRKRDAPLPAHGLGSRLAQVSTRSLPPGGWMRRVSQIAAGIVLFHVVDGERRYLLVRSALTRRPIWEFPKGGVEAGETDEIAAERELQEEAGVRADDYRVLGGFREEERYVFTQG